VFSCTKGLVQAYTKSKQTNPEDENAEDENAQMVSELQLTE